MEKRKALKKPFVGTLLILGLFFIILGSCQKASVEKENSKRIVIGLLPNEREKDLKKLKTELGTRLRLEVEFDISKDYSTLIEKFKNGSVDFAFFPPLTFITAEKTANAKVLLKKVYGKNEFYYSAILVRKESKIKNLADLKGKTFGFVDKKSASGYLYPRVMLRAAGLDAGEGLSPGPKVLNSQFFGTHQDTLKALLDKKVDAVSVWADEPGSNLGAWTDPQFSKDVAKRIRIVTISDPIPNDAFAVREDFYKKNALIVFNVMEALIGMSSGESKVMKEVFDVDGMATATSRHYDSVRLLDKLLLMKAQ